MRKIINIFFLLSVMIVLSGCEIGDIYTIPRIQAQKVLEEKYDTKFAELEFVNDEIGPIPIPFYAVNFSTYPIDNEEQVFKVETTNWSGKIVEDNYLWYLLGDEYVELISKNCDNTLEDFNGEYSITVTNDERKMSSNYQNVTKDTSLEVALNAKLINADIYIIVYSDELNEEEFINVGNRLVENLRNENVNASLWLESYLTSEGYEFRKSDPNMDYTKYSDLTHMSYSFAKISDLDREYYFTILNEK